MSRERRPAATINFSPPASLMPPAPPLPQEKVAEESPAPHEPDKLLAVACRRLKDGTYLVFTVRRLNGVPVEAPWGRPADSHLIAAGRLTDAMLLLGSEL